MTVRRDTECDRETGRVRQSDTERERERERERQRERDARQRRPLGQGTALSGVSLRARSRQCRARIGSETSGRSDQWASAERVCRWEPNATVLSQHCLATLSVSLSLCLSLSLLLSFSVSLCFFLPLSSTRSCSLSSSVSVPLPLSLCHGCYSVVRLSPTALNASASHHPSPPPRNLHHTVI